MEIDLKGYYKLITRRFWIVAAFVVLFTLPTSVLTKDTYVPYYQASTELMVSSSSPLLDFNALSVIIRTPVLLDKVAEWYPDLRMTSEQLGSSISVAAENGSQVMRIRAVDTDPKRAVEIANTVSQVVQAVIPNMMPVEAVTILNPATESSSPQPINPKSHKYVMMIILSFCGAIVTAVALIFLLDALDETLKTEDDIRSIFGKPTLAVVPKVQYRKLRGTPVRQAVKQASEEVAYAANHQ